MGVRYKFFCVQMDFFFDAIGSGDLQLHSKALQYLRDTFLYDWRETARKKFETLSEEYLTQLIVNGTTNWYPYSIPETKQDKKAVKGLGRYSGRRAVPTPETDNFNVTEFDQEFVVAHCVVAILTQGEKFYQKGESGISAYWHLKEDLFKDVVLNQRLQLLWNYFINGRPFPNHPNYYCVLTYLTNSEIAEMQQSLTMYEESGRLKYLESISLERTEPSESFQIAQEQKYASLIAGGFNLLKNHLFADVLELGTDLYAIISE